jgi:phosphate transport system permease protein
MTATIAAELGETVRGGEHWRVLFLLGVVLFVITSGLNRVGAWATDRLARRLGREEGR